MAKYLLVSRNAKEVVDVQRLNGNLSEAKEYFVRLKDLPEDKFDELYIVTRVRDDER